VADFEFASLVLEFEAELPLPLVDTAAARLPAFESLVRDLYPNGRAWSTAPASVTAGVLRAIAAAIVEVELQVDRFQTDTNPARTIDLVSEWERALGLPDPCLGSNQNMETRRASITSRLAGNAGVSTPEVLAMFAALGYTVTLLHFSPLKAGSALAGHFVYGIAWQYVLGIQYLGSADRALLECALGHRLPAQVVLVFYYGEFEPQELALDFYAPPIDSIT
jgi:uncharacterized protein YmfQ (DUF2313 family)